MLKWFSYSPKVCLIYACILVNLGFNEQNNNEQFLECFDSKRSWCIYNLRIKQRFILNRTWINSYVSSRPDVLLGKGFLKTCNKFTGEHPCRSAISIKLLCSFIEIALWNGCSPINLLYIFGSPFFKKIFHYFSISVRFFPFHRFLQKKLESN